MQAKISTSHKSPMELLAGSHGSSDWPKCDKCGTPYINASEHEVDPVRGCKCDDKEGA